MALGLPGARLKASSSECFLLDFCGQGLGFRVFGFRRV